MCNSVRPLEIEKMKVKQFPLFTANSKLNYRLTWCSRACRLKKKAQHEANKLKLYGLEQEHSMYIQIQLIFQFYLPLPLFHIQMACLLVSAWNWVWDIKYISLGMDVNFAVTFKGNKRKVFKGNKIHIIIQYTVFQYMTFLALCNK
jgi:hypothetical protein